MKYIFGLIVILAGAYFFPQIITSTGSPCQALEAKVVESAQIEDPTAAALAGILTSVSKGEIGKLIADEEYPSLPQPLGCALAYYTFDSEEFRP